MTNFGRNIWLQKGVKVEWFDGHKKGTGVIVTLHHEEPSVNYWSKNMEKGVPTSFDVKDDDTGNIMKFLAKDIKKIPSNRDKKRRY